MAAPQPRSTSRLNSSKVFKSSIAHKPNQAQNFLKQTNDLTIENSDTSGKGKKNLSFLEEWEILLMKIKEWTGISLPANQSEWVVNPSILIIGFFALILILKTYLNFTSAFEAIPILPNIFEVVGAFWSARFLLTHGLRKKDREKFIFDSWKRWKNFSQPSEKIP